MPQPDLILLHAPSVYDFRKKPILYGPVSDVIPSAQIFEMYPIGFMTILGYLERHGYSVRIINLALRMLRSARFDPERLIRSVDPAAFGIDLHWMAHAHGSLEVASLVKKHHPRTPVIFGGLSASYFHEELVRYPQVDYVMRGDCTEEPLRMLMERIKAGDPPDDVPNLTWKSDGEVQVNEMSYVPESLDDMPFDYGDIMRSCLRHRDLIGHFPFRAWLSYPIVMALPCHGCTRNCAICGGSASAFRRICGRKRPVFRSPECVAGDVAAAARFSRSPIMILSDILQGGEDYARELLRAMKKEKISNHIAFEFFEPPPPDILRLAADAVPNFNFQISPESHDERVRSAFGRNYTNDALEESIACAADVGCKRVDLFFMIGIPEQTPESAMGTVEYCGRLLERFEGRGYARNIRPFISPLAPFIDPGSNVFEEPEKHGYRMFCRTLEDHRLALAAPSWKRTLNYQTVWMNRDQIAEVTYGAALALNGIKGRFGLIGQDVAAEIESRIETERDLMHQLDDAYEMGSPEEREGRARRIMSEFDSVHSATICRKDEMNWPTAFLRFRPLQVIRSVLSRH